jgi:molybdopterin synthase sulfur carrier subunit
MREITGRREDTFQLEHGSVVQDFLNSLSKRYGSKLSEYLLGDKDHLRKGLNLLVNGQAIDTSKLETVLLKDNDLIVILPPIGGG